MAREDVSCTFFQTPAWLNLTADFLKARPHPFLFEWEDASAVLPLLCRRRPWGKAYFPPFGTYSGLVTAQELDAGRVREISSFLSSRNVLLVSNPFSSHVVRLKETRRDFTSAVPLTGREGGDLLGDWERDARRRARVAEGAGVCIRRAAIDADLRAYDAVYRQALSRWGDWTRTVYSARFLAALWAALKDGASMRLWLAEKEGAVLGGCLAFYHNRHAVLWHGATLPEAFSLGVTQLLYREILLDARGRGFGVCDFNPSAGLSGVRAFKKSLGTREYPFEVFSSRPAWLALADRFRRRPGPGNSRLPALFAPPAKRE